MDLGVFVAGQLVQKPVIAVKHIDVGQPIAVGAQLPVAGFQQLGQILGGQKFWVLFLEFVGIGQNGCFVVVLFQYLFGVHGRIPAAVLKQKEQRLVRQGGAPGVVVCHIFLADGYIAQAVQCSQLGVQLPDGYQGVGTLAVNPEVGNREKTLIRPADHIGVRGIIGGIFFGRGQRTGGEEQNDNQKSGFQDGADELPDILLCFEFKHWHGPPAVYPRCCFPSSSPAGRQCRWGSCGYPRWISRR